MIELDGGGTNEMIQEVIVYSCRMKFNMPFLRASAMCWGIEEKEVWHCVNGL